MIKIISYADRVLVELKSNDDVFLTNGHLEGVVVSCGTHHNKEVEIDIKEGDTILIDKNAVPYETEYEGKTLHFFRKINILAIVKS